MTQPGRRVDPTPRFRRRWAARAAPSGVWRIIARFIGRRVGGLECALRPVLRPALGWAAADDASG